VKVYLDMCSIQRPLDTRTQPRIAVEAEAILGVLTLCEAGRVEMLSSATLLFEVERNPHPLRREYAQKVLANATTLVPADNQVEERARKFEAEGIKPVDALHLASAVVANADYFCTCDDRFLKRAKAVDTGQTKVLSPLELITEVTQ
jgi:predicted nucleic acid-binding protein